MRHLIGSVFILFVVFSENSNGKPSKGRVYNNLSFAIPGLSLLQGANVNSNGNYNNRVTSSNSNNNLGNNLIGGGNNFFRQATVTRTIVRTVSTVTQAAFRTCTMPVAQGVNPCAGRRKREAAEDNLIEDHDSEINPEPTMFVIIESTTIRDQKEVSSILNLDVRQDEPIPTTDNINNRDLLDGSVDETTTLYPSNEPSGIVFQDDTMAIYERSNDQPNDSDSGTETPILDDDITTTNPEVDVEQNLGLNENARLGLGGTTTVTTTIGVTSVATTYASGAGLTLSVSYTGCLPPTLPVTGTACTP